jgi:hypothetical protein
MPGDRSGEILEIVGYAAPDPAWLRRPTICSGQSGDRHPQLALASQRHTGVEFK